MPYLPKKTTRPRNDRKKEAQAIYNTTRWIKLRDAKLMANPICEVCNKELATQVHHKIPFLQFQGQLRKDVAYNYNNLMSVCNKCHTEIHKKAHNNER